MSTLNVRSRPGSGCDIEKCKADWDLRLEAGSTLLNPTRRVKLCSKHWSAWLEREDELRNKDKPVSFHRRVKSGS